MYFPMLSSMFKKNEYRRKVISKLELIIDDVNSLFEWDKEYIDDCNRTVVDGGDKDEYNKDYLELQRIINKILKVKENY